MDKKFRASFIPCGDAPKLLEATEEALNDMTLTISMTIIGTLLKARFARRDGGLCPGRLDASNKSVRVIAFIRDHLIDLKSCNERRCLRNVVHLTIRKAPTQGIAQRINDHMNLGAQSATRSADGLRTFFFWAPAACWWARTMVLSSIRAWRSASVLTASMMRCQTPAFPHRENRVYTLCQLPSCGGRSRHGLPVRAIHRTASTNSRLSFAVTPRSLDLPGNKCSMRSHWSFRSIFRMNSGLAARKTRMYRYHTIVYRP
jgi:hypothetical protein